MDNKNITKKFIYYCLPSVICLFLSGFYSIIDGLLVGRTTSDIGLAAINIAWPINALITALGVGIGTGGSVIYSTYLGENKEKEAKVTQYNTLITLVLSIIVAFVTLRFSYKNILILLGAEGKVLDEAINYSKIMIYGCGPQIIGVGLVPILKNNSMAFTAMLSMFIGMITNVVLDIYFIVYLKFGIGGAALATIIGQLVSAIFSIIFLLYRKNINFKNKDIKIIKLKRIKDIIKISMSPFGISIAPSIVLVLTNWQCLKYGGDTIVATYAVISYVVFPVQSLLSGVGEGIQPLISFYKGAGEEESIKKVKKLAYRTSIALSILLTIAVLFNIRKIAIIFGLSSEAQMFFKSGMFISVLAFLFIGIVKLKSSLYYAYGDIKSALLIIYGEVVIIAPIALIILPILFKVNGIWLSLLFTQLAIIIIEMMKREVK